MGRKAVPRARVLVRVLTPSVKTSKAYIASLGTSGVLISSFLLLLLVGSAIVAFNGIPGTGAADGLERVVVDPESGDVSRAGADASDARARAREESDGRRAGRADRARDGGERVGIDRRGSGAGGAELEGGAPGTSSPGTDGGGQSDGGGQGDGGSTVRVPQTPNLPSVGTGGGTNLPDAGDVTGGVGGAVEQVGGDVGGVVGGVSPELGGTVTETGETVGGTVGGVGETVDETVGGLPSLP